jgi:asparagine synthase (glutamine-hydrolysing)
MIAEPTPAGIYALAALDGAPLAEAGLKTLGLDQVEHVGSLAARALDPQVSAIHTWRTGDELTLLAGYLDEPEELAATLGMNAATPPAQLAAVALDRLGNEAPAHLLGEWSLLRWDSRTRKLTLAISENTRDPLFVAHAGNLVAVSPSAWLLGGLDWVGRALDPAGFALGQSRAGLRHSRTTETLWRGIRSVQPGSTETFSVGQHSSARMMPLCDFERWQGTFDEGAEALNDCGRRIVRQHMERHPVSAFLLSGGLDSSLINSWGAYERGPGRSMFAVSSIAPPGSGRADEQRWIDAVADALEIDCRKTWPVEEGNLFQPSADAMRRAEGIVSGTTIVQDALSAVALAGGATAVFDGVAGEMHISNGFEIPETRSRLRIRAARLRDELARRRQFRGWPAAAFHIRLQPELLQALPPEWAQVWRKGTPRDPEPARGDPPMGINHMMRKQATLPTATADGLRNLMPYRDQRLTRLAARMPSSFLRHGGLTRPLARRMLLGRVPDLVRLRDSYMPFAPDYVSRLKRQAAGVHARIPIYREAGVGRWLDLDWLSEGLVRLAATRDEHDYTLYYEVQGTATAAEFLLWAHSRGVRF